MEASYLTVEFFRKLPQEVDRLGNPGERGGNPGERGGNPGERGGNPSGERGRGGNPSGERGRGEYPTERGGNPTASNVDRYSEGHFRRIGSNVSAYVGMVSDTLKNTIPKAVVYCQVREAKMSLLNHFYTLLGKKEVCTLFA